MDIAKYGIAIDARQVKDAEKALDGMGAAGARAEKSLDGMSAQAKIAGGVLGTVLAASATVAAKSLLSAQIEADKLANTLKFATGANNLRAELDFTRKTAETLGLELISSSQAYAKLAAAAKDTSLEGKATRDIFTAVGKASTVMGLSASESQGALLAISQMMSKGTVQAEELRGQLGERIPGAFQMAARAMGVTTSELGKMLEQGQVVSDDFLPKFAAELERTLGDQAGSAAMSAQAGLNKLANEWTLLKQAMAGTEEWKNTSGWMIESTTNWVKNLRAAVEQGDWFDKLQWLTTGRVSGETTMKAQGRRFIGGIEQIVPPEPAKAAQYKQPELSTQDRQLLDGLRTAQEKAADTRAQLYNLLVQDKISLDEYNKRLAALMEKGAKKGSAGGDRITDYQRLVESSRDRIAVLQAELTSETKLTEGEKHAAKMLADVRSGKLKLTAAEREHLEAMAGAIGQMSRYQAQQAEQAEGVKRLAEEERKRNEELQASVKHDQDALDVLKIRTDLMMLGVTATEDVAVALLEAQLASKDFTTATYEEIDALERRIGIAREAAQVAREGRRYESQQRAAKDAAQNAAREWERASEQIAQSLTDNIMRGGKSAGELLQDYFRTLVLRPIIQGTVQAGLNAVGLGGGAGGLLQTGANLVGLSGVGLGSLGTMTSYGAAAATGGLLGGASQGAMLAAQTAEFGAAGAAATAEALGGVASSLGAVSAALGPIGIGLGVLAMGGLFDDEGDAMRTGNWQGGLGQATRSPDNQWFSDAEMGAALGRFSESLAKSEKGVISALELSAEQIDTINSDIEELVGKRYDFGMEHTEIPEATFAQISRDRFAEVFDEIGAGLGDIVRASGDSYQSVMQTVGALVQSADAFRYIDGNLSGLTATTIAAAGGIADFGNATAFYLGNFYTENERLALSMSELLPQFQALGYDHVPRTRDEFRLLVESLDLTSEAGQRARGELLGLADDVAAVTDASTVRARREEYTPTVWSAAPTRAAEEAQQAASELARNRRILEIQIMELTGDAAGALAAQRADELESMDASLRPLQQRIYALDDERRITEARTAWQERLDVLTGARTQRQIDLMRDLAGVTDAATAATVRQVHALEAQMSAADSAMSALRRAADAEQERLKKARDGAEKNLATVSSVFDIVTEGARALRREVKTLDAMRLSEARAYIDMATALAQAGAVPDEKQLARAVDALAADSERGYTTLAEFEFAQLAQAAKLDKLGKLTGDQKSLAQKQLDAIDGQTTILEDQLDAAQRQIDALNGVNSSVLSVTAAIAALGFAVDAARQTQVAGGGGGPLARYSDAQISGAVDFVSARAAAGDIGGIVTEAQRLGVTSAELAAVIQRAGYEGITQADVLGWTASHGMPSFATGVNAGILPADTMLQAHGGERITPAAFVDLERADREQTNALLARLVAANEALRTEMAQLKADMALTQRNTRRSADTLDNVTDGGDAMRVDVVATV